MRISRIYRALNGTGGAELFPLRRLVLWVLIGAAIVAALVLYFRYARQVTPLIG